MTSNWQIGKDASNYHFDKWCQEEHGTTHKVIGKFVGDWQEELEVAYNKMKLVTWAARWDEYGKTDPREDTIDFKEAELNDLRNAGADPDMIMYRGLKLLGPVMTRMVEALSLTNSRHKLQIQQTGDMVVTHFDKHYEHGDDATKTRRFLIALADWEQGQFVNFGNDIFQQWHAGDIMTFDWINVPHATANASFHSRPFLQVTGVMTDRTCELMNNFATISV